MGLVLLPGIIKVTKVGLYHSLKPPHGLSDKACVYVDFWHLRNNSGCFATDRSRNTIRRCRLAGKYR